MNRAANVTSIEAIEQFRGETQRYSEAVREVSVTLLMELRRAIHWLRQDRATYWPAQVRKASDAVAQARNSLANCQLSTRADERPACYDQQHQLELALRRLRYAEDRMKSVQRWLRVTTHDVDQFQGLITKMMQSMDVDVPRALLVLDRMSAALRQYAGLTPIGEGSLPTLPSAARPAHDDGHPKEES